MPELKIHGFLGIQGTWNGPDADTVTMQLADMASQRGIPVHTVTGIGTGSSKWLAGAFGWGFDAKVREAYTVMRQNYTAGERWVICGFSRGAAIALHLAELLSRYGHSASAREAWKDYSETWQAPYDGFHYPRVQVFALDPVQALGMPNVLGGKAKLDAWINRQVGLPQLNPNSHVHEQFEDIDVFIAAEENRATFEPFYPGPEWGFLVFPGTHTDVGGGGNPLLSNCVSTWIATRIGWEVSGLPVDAMAAPTPVSGGLLQARAIPAHGRQPLRW